MKNIKFWVAFGVLFHFTASCKKENTYQSANTATINVINGAIGIPSVMVKVNGKFNPGNTSSSSSLSKLNYGSNAFFYAKGTTIPLQLLNGADTSNILDTNYDLSNGVYSLLVAGQSPRYEAVLVPETGFPFFPYGIKPGTADSVINIRFINLSPNVQPLDIKLVSSGTTEVTGLAYKGYSPFEVYPAKLVNGSYQFQIIENGIVLLTQTLSVNATNRFKNVALVVRGLKSPGTGQPGLAVSTVNYFQ
jgi:hypothetical protein